VKYPAHKAGFQNPTKIHLPSLDGLRLGEEGIERRAIEIPFSPSPSSSPIPALDGASQGGGKSTLRLPRSKARGMLKVDAERRLFAFRVNPLRMNPTLKGKVLAPSKYQ